MINVGNASNGGVVLAAWSFKILKIINTNFKQVSAFFQWGFQIRKKKFFKLKSRFSHL
jgi:hypothetical protein